MGRKTSVGYRFLIKRPDASAYSYIRDIPQSCRAYVSGDIFCSWKRETRPVGGGAVIKLSLGTGDLQTAAARWSEVHTQVEAILRNAHDRTNVLVGRQRVVRRISGLTQDEIRALGQRYYKSALERDDEALLDVIERRHAAAALVGSPDFLKPLSMPETRHAEMQAFGREFDQALSVELDGDYARFDSAVHFGKHGNAWSEDEPTPEGDSIDWTEASEVEDLLAGVGVELPRKHPDRRRLAVELVRQKVAAQRVLMGRRTGEAVPVQNVLPTMSLASLQDQGPGLLMVFDLWKNERRPTEASAREYEVYLKRFIAIFGDLGVKDIDRDKIKAFRDHMRDFPRKVPADKKRLSTLSLIEWAKGDPSVPKLSIGTVNGKAIGALSAVLGIAVACKKIDENPCSRTKLALKPGEKEKRKRPPYSKRDLRVLFSSPVYSQGKRPVGGAGEACFWLPFLAAFTGARLEELGQLRVCDIQRDEESDVVFFDLLEIDDEPGQTTHLKTATSRRKIPICETVHKAGFMLYVERMRADGNVRLFPQLLEYRGKRTVHFSKWWGRYARVAFAGEQKRDPMFKIDKRKCFHSFRHAFTDAGRHAAIPYSLLQQLLGHSSKTDQTSEYGNGYPMSLLFEGINKLSYPGVSWPAVADYAAMSSSVASLAKIDAYNQT